MKDKQARILAIIALVFMAAFIAALISTLVDYTLLGGSIGFIALGTGVFVFMIFIALKADGRGYSITKMNNEMEMEKIEKALKEQVEKEETEKEQAEKTAVDGEDAATPNDEAE